MSDIEKSAKDVEALAKAFEPTDDVKSDLKTLAGMIGDLAELVDGTPKQIQDDADQRMRQALAGTGGGL